MKDNSNIHKKQLGEPDRKDQSNVAFEEWMNDSNAQSSDYSTFRKIWDRTGHLASANRFDSQLGWQKLNSQLAGMIGRNRQLIRLRIATIGMAASILLILGFAFYANWFVPSVNKIEIATANGSRSEIILPDGTMVKLNSGSSLNYSYNKITRQRIVDFNGEGFFQVSKNNHPFIIRSADGMNLKVLGTRFNYSNYSDGREIRTTLEEGKVELTSSFGEKIVMSPGQVVAFDKKSKQMQLLKINPTHSYGWMDDKLYMDNMPLVEVCQRLERRYDVKISFSPDNFAKDIHYTGVLQEETVSTVLKVLSELSSIEYQMKGRNILITKK